MMPMTTSNSTNVKAFRFLSRTMFAPIRSRFARIVDVQQNEDLLASAIRSFRNHFTFAGKATVAAFAITFGVNRSTEKNHKVKRKLHFLQITNLYHLAARAPKRVR